ncbi:MAG: nucleotidyltransferase substrate binding protein [Treponema sp.]|nr:nucleotidyltransferase substrate binding protein [Treponema sp.]
MSGELAMDDTADVRWKQRFENYKKALAVLRRGLESVSPEKEVDEFQKLGIIQAFEFTQELSWKVMKDFITNSGGGEKIYGSKDAVRQAFNRSLISDGETWMDMIDSRNESSHLYDETTSDKIFSKISSLYLPCFSALEKTLSDLAGQEKDE